MSGRMTPLNVRFRNWKQSDVGVWVVCRHVVDKIGASTFTNPANSARLMPKSGAIASQFTNRFVDQGTRMTLSGVRQPIPIAPELETHAHGGGYRLKPYPRVIDILIDV